MQIILCKKLIKIDFLLFFRLLWDFLRSFGELIYKMSFLYSCVSGQSLGRFGRVLLFLIIYAVLPDLIIDCQYWCWYGGVAVGGLVGCLGWFFFELAGRK